MILSFAIGFGNQYNKQADDIGGGSLNLSAFEEEIEDVGDAGEDYRQRFDSGSVDDIDDASGIFSIATDMITVITSPFRLLSQVLENILGFPTLVTNVLLGILAISLIFAIWRVLRAGE